MNASYLQCPGCVLLLLLLLMLLFNTTRVRTPDPQARGPLSLWSEAWPTQPVLTLPYAGRPRATCIGIVKNV